MKSIQRHILLWLLPGFFLLWLVTGYALFLSVKQRYEVEMDAELRELWAALPFGNPSGRSSLLSIEDFVRDDFGIYFQIWTAEGLRILKSENLGRFDLPRNLSMTEEPEYSNTVLESGEPVRMLSVATREGSLGELHLVVAKTREEVLLSLRTVLFAIIGVGVAAVSIFAFLLTLAIRSGLRPLDEVGEKAAGISLEDQSERLSVDNLPVELRPIATRLDEMFVRIRESFAREKRFSADLAHELRTPVAALRSIAEVALKWPDQASDEDYRDIRDISGELQDTVESLLLLAKLDQSGGELDISSVDPVPLIDASWKTHAERAEERKVSFSNRMEPGRLIETDAKLFQMVVGNLISNAVEYAPEESEIIVDSGGEGDGVVRCINRAPHLEEADLAKMFDRLWRHDEARSDSSHSGLGLSIARTAAGVLGFNLEATLEDGWIHFVLK